LQSLFNILKENHWMASLFKTAADVFENLSSDLQLQFRMLVVDANKKGMERTIENVFYFKYFKIIYKLLG
jgi:hypothetical protein